MILERFFSIIIPLYNKEEYVIKTLKSIRDQDFFNYEVIVIDDSSADSSYEVACNFISNNNLENYFIYKNENNKGVSYSRNRGLELSKGTYIIFLDADDEIGKHDFLSTMNYYIEKYNCNYMVVARNYYNRFVKPKIKLRKNHLLKLEKDLYKIIDKDVFVDYTNFPFGGSASAILSKELIYNKRFNIHEKNFEDWEFFFDRYTKSSPYFCTIPYIKINYVENSLSKQKKMSNEVWTIPSLYNLLGQENKIKLQKKFFWIWLASMFKKNPTKQNAKENIQMNRSNILKNTTLTKYSIYCMIWIILAYIKSIKR